MARAAVASGLAALLLVGAAEANELDRQREFDEGQRERRAAYEQSFERLRRAEPERIRAEEGRIVRNGGELQLALEGNRKTFMHDDESQCLRGLIPARQDTCVEFLFVGHPVERFYVLRARYFAGSDYRLVDRVTGFTTKILAEPHFSPDGIRAVAVSSAEAFDPVGIEMWSVGSKGPTLEWQHTPEGYALYYFVRWEGAASVALEVSTYVDHDLRHSPARLTLADRGWVLDGPNEASRY
ncbi:MAG TPA: hypothetical protein VET85_17870 [Stellaceae bacterium]|nr:hypothetical protein [Stellaceae bacterium]